MNIPRITSYHPMGLPLPLAVQCSLHPTSSLGSQITSPTIVSSLCSFASPHGLTLTSENLESKAISFPWLNEVS